jgi:hypothetical protein
LAQLGDKYIVMARLIEQRFREWTRGKNAAQARVSIYQKIRDIPYAVIPELADAERYVEILKLGRGSCMPKHFLLCNMYQRLGMLVLYVVYPFRWDEAKVDYPPRLRRLAAELPTNYHLACKVDIDGEIVLVDATLDTALGRLGFPVNEEWDGESNTLLPINPCGEEQLYHPSEAHLMEAHYDEKSLAFYNELNSWLEDIREL